MEDSSSKPAIVYMGNTTIKAVLPTDIAIQLESCCTRTTNIKIFSFLLGIAGWIMCITSTASVQWRVWYIQNATVNTSDTIWIGIWKVCFMQDTVSGEDDKMLCHIFREKDSYIPMEIFLAQDLMTLAIIVEAMAMLFLCLGFWNIYEDKNYTKLVSHLFFIASIWNLISGLLILMPTSLNMISVLTKNKISFPAELQLPDEPQEQAIGVALYVGVVSASLQILSASFILIEKCVSVGSQIHPREIPKSHAITCPHCNSSLEIRIKKKIISESTCYRETPADSIEQFTIPTGSVRSRTISSTDFHRMLVGSDNP